jgi:hypothetical protein
MWFASLGKRMTIIAAVGARFRRMSLLAVVAHCAACGARVVEESRPHDGPDAGGAKAKFPAKDGVPFGDCVDLDTTAQMTQGCPSVEPAPESACDVPGKTCRYARVDGSTTYQLVLSCLGNYWGSGALEACGEVCDPNDANPIDFPGADCSTRPAAACDDGKGTSYGFPPDAYTLTSAMLQSTLEACNSDIADNLVWLTLNGGCPVRLSSMQPLAPSAVTCLEQKLSNARWSCATTLPCLSRQFTLL